MRLPRWGMIVIREGGREGGRGVRAAKHERIKAFKNC